MFEYRDDDKPSTFAPNAPTEPAEIRDRPSAVGSGEVVRHVGRLVVEDGHNPLVVGSYPRTETTDADGEVKVTYAPASGTPARWSSALPGWSDAIGSNVVKGRNKRGPTARVARHGVVRVDVIDGDAADRLSDRLNGRPAVRLSDAQLSDMATHWARMACLGCADVREACENDHAGNEMCRECATGCGCMPDAIGAATMAFAAVVDSPGAIDRDAPASGIVRNQDGTESASSIKRRERRELWKAECHRRADQGWSAWCADAIAHSHIDGGLVPSAQAAEYLRSEVVRKGAEHAPRLSWPQRTPRRQSRLSRPADRKRARVDVIGKDANGRQILGKRTTDKALSYWPSTDTRPASAEQGDLVELVGWSDTTRGYWVGHRFVASTPRSVKRASVKRLKADRAAQAAEIQAATDKLASDIGAWLTTLDIGVSTTRGAMTVERTRADRWLIDGKTTTRARAIARLTVATMR